jgi:Sec7-like guanine-nucleotide exchange factor
MGVLIKIRIVVRFNYVGVLFIARRIFKVHFTHAHALSLRIIFDDLSPIDSVLLPINPFSRLMKSIVCKKNNHRKCVSSICQEVYMMTCIVHTCVESIKKYATSNYQDEGLFQKDFSQPIFIFYHLHHHAITFHEI